MRFSVPTTLLLLAPGLFAAEEPQRSGTPRSLIPGKPLTESSSPIPAISLLPEGSVLEKVMMPRYDKNRKLTSVLRCEEMTLVSADLISGKTVSIESFNPDRSAKARIDLTTALFDQKRNLLKANEAVTIVSTRVTAEGTGLIYALDRQKGFLIGPASTTITNPRPTAMNPARPALRATAFLGASLLPLVAQTPALTPKPPEATPADAVSKAAEAATATKAARSDLGSILQASDAANKATAEFLQQADLLAANGIEEPPPQPVPLNLKPDPEATTISCQGGIYLDPDLTATTAVLVYLKGVKVDNPQILLKGANELKVFFERTPADKAKAKAAPAGEGASPGLKKAAEKESKNLGGIDLGDPRRIVATGAVAIELKPKEGKEPILASGAYFSYDLVTGDIVLRGGSPWIIQGDKVMQAMAPNLGIYIKKNYTFTTDEGPWDQRFRIPKQEN